MKCSCERDAIVVTVLGWLRSVRSRTTIWSLPRRVTNARLAEGPGVALAFDAGVAEASAPVAGGLPELQAAANRAVAATSRIQRPDLQVIKRKRHPEGLVMGAQPEWKVSLPSLHS